jgi:hypothetical protein
MQTLKDTLALLVTFVSIGWIAFILPSCSPAVIAEVEHEAVIAEDAILQDLECQAGLATNGGPTKSNCNTTDAGTTGCMTDSALVGTS